ncbi:MAG: hypothetical protein KAX31_05060, partial [Thermoplasmata archaeon]|nr:hypothetical protein [Thermoplasmata archaeon]
YGVECPFCNAVINAGEDICPECGMPLIEEEGIKEEPEVDEFRKPERDWYRIIAFALVIILLASAMTPFLLPLPHVDRAQVRIDGSFDDWVQVTNHTDSLDGINPNVDIINYKLLSDFFNVYFFIQVQGNIFGDQAGDTARIFIDLDQDESTGYHIQGIGADFQIRVFGHAGDVESASCLRFNGIYEQDDFNGFESYCPAVPYASDDAVEVRLALEDLGVDWAQNMTTLAYMGDSFGDQDFIDMPVPNRGGLLYVSQSSAAPANGLVTGVQAAMVNLDLTVVGSGFVLNDVVVGGYTIGGGTGFPTQLNENDTLALTVNRALAGHAPGDFIGCRVSAANFDVTGSQVAVVGDGGYAYVQSAPALIEIDGAFADWAGKGQSSSDTPDDVMAKNNVDALTNPALDITEMGTVAENNNVNFYLDVAGRMF